MFEEVPEGQIDSVRLLLAVTIAQLLQDSQLPCGAPTAMALAMLSASNAKLVGKTREEFAVMAAAMYDCAPELQVTLRQPTKEGEGTDGMDDNSTDTDNGIRDPRQRH